MNRIKELRTDSDMKQQDQLELFPYYMLLVL